MDLEIAQYFRDCLRNARALMLRDSEAYESVVLVMERIGQMLGAHANGLSGYRHVVAATAKASPLASEIPDAWPDYHLSFVALFDLVREARNAAVHEGAFARHLTAHALEIALVLEDALMQGSNTLGDFMVRSPIVALPWQPLSFVRQTMLTNSFSYLPVRVPELESGRWQVVSDVTLAGFVRPGRDRKTRETRLKMTMRQAAIEGHIKLEMPVIATAKQPVWDLLPRLGNLPILVVGQNADAGTGFAVLQYAA